MNAQAFGASVEQLVRVQIGGLSLEGHLDLPTGAPGVVVFAHGSGSSRHSPRNRLVARTLHDAGLGTLLFDLLTADEEQQDIHTSEFRFDIDLLAERVIGAIDWLAEQSATAHVLVGCFGASTGAAAALVAAAHRPHRVGAVVSRGGRPDLAANDLPRVRAPTMLIVGSLDLPVIGLNRQALERLGSPVKELHIIPEATHLFEEAGTLEEVARLAGDWFARHLVVSGK
jgi:dienelactone hydrolase